MLHASVSAWGSIFQQHSSSSSFRDEAWLAAIQHQHIFISLSWLTNSCLSVKLASTHKSRPATSTYIVKHLQSLCSSLLTQYAKIQLNSTSCQLARCSSTHPTPVLCSQLNTMQQRLPKATPWCTRCPGALACCAWMWDCTEECLHTNLSVGPGCLKLLTVTARCRVIDWKC